MRPRTGTVKTSPYKYQDTPEKSALIQCEEDGDHCVRPGAWPPPRTAMTTADPSMSLQCELCGAWLVVYEAHATGEMEGIKVVLTDAQKQAQEKRARQTA